MTADSLASGTAPSVAARQRIEFRDGNEAAAIAARQLGSLAIDGDRVGAAAVCYGAALSGARVCATSARGLTGELGQLCVQSQARVPMVLNVPAHAVSAMPEDGCDHSDLYYALGAGWIVLCARDPQAVYDFNLAAVRIGEHPDVRLPVLVAYDGLVTSREKRGIHVIDDPQALASFAGTPPAIATPLDTAHAATFGARIGEADRLNQGEQRSQAMEAARRVIPEIFAELAALTGRCHAAVDAYEMEDAEAAVVLVNSAAEAAKEAVDVWREMDRRVGVLSPNWLRPFPAREFRALLRGVKAATVGDRADSCGADGGTLSIEIRAALQQDPGNRTRILSRIYGLGGKDFHGADAEQLLGDAYEAATSGTVRDAFTYHASPAAARGPAPPGLPPVTAREIPRGMAKVRRNAATGRLEVELEPLWKMTAVPGRIAPGHSACPGCGAFAMLHQAYKALEGDVVVLFESGCAAVVTTDYPSSAHRVNYVHNPSGNGAATLAGLVEAYHERVRRGELAASKDITFVMVAGDGAMETGLAAAVDAAQRNTRMLVLEYDNQGRMSAGGTATHSGPAGARHSETAQVLAACHLPYVFTASEGYPEDLLRKVAKAQWYVKNEGMAYGRILSFCPLHWKTADDAAQPVLQAAIDSCFFPLYEVERGHTTITYDPDATGRRKPVAEWLKLMGKTAHLAEAANAAQLEAIQAETERRWARLKAMHEHPLL